MEGKGNTVIDYAMEEKRLRGKIKRMKIGDKVDLDHQ